MTGGCVEPDKLAEAKRIVEHYLRMNSAPIWRP